jgi:hypothetical protein
MFHQRMAQISKENSSVVPLDDRFQLTVIPDTLTAFSFVT